MLKAEAELERVDRLLEERMQYMQEVQAEAAADKNGTEQKATRVFGNNKFFYPGKFGGCGDASGLRIY